MGCAIGAAVCFGAYVIAMVIALAQLAGCDEDVCRALMWPAAIGLILGLMCLASAIVAAVFAGKASTATGKGWRQAWPKAPTDLLTPGPSRLGEADGERARSGFGTPGE